MLHTLTREDVVRSYATLLAVHAEAMGAAYTGELTAQYTHHAAEATRLVRPLRRAARGTEGPVRSIAKAALAHYRAQPVPATVYLGV